MLDLTVPAAKETALLELSKKRESFPELAPYLWHSFGTMAALLQEIVSIYPMLQPPSLTAHASNRVCNALALLQCVASHPETRSLFLQGARAWGSWAGHGRWRAAACSAPPNAWTAPAWLPLASAAAQAAFCVLLLADSCLLYAARCLAQPPSIPPPLPSRSAHPALPLPLPQHHLQDAAL